MTVRLYPPKAAKFKPERVLAFRMQEIFRVRSGIIYDESFAKWTQIGAI
jgi:hypothetical protein